MSEELKPCPFCEGQDINYYYSGSSHWTFECLSCKTELNMWVRVSKESWDNGHGEHQEAIKRWNTRAKTDATKAAPTQKNEKTLRDEFALAKLSGIVWNGSPLTEVDMKEVAAECYKFADVMLETRNK